MPAPAQYRGRFAPSPTGPLHFGSLVAALGSYLDARSVGGAWLLRMEDLDPPREVPGAADDILRTLDALGFEWDESVLYQSTRTDAYADAVERLTRLGLVFPCGCSRREISASGRLGAEGPVYPGTCRERLPPGRKARSVRLRTTPDTILVRDRMQGDLVQDLEREIGDFVLRRADGIHAYQLAVVVDDAHQRITDVVRGADLLLSTPRQVYLQQALGFPAPRYAHLPVAVDAAGRKLSKSEDAAPVVGDPLLTRLLDAWRFLAQRPFPEIPADVGEFWSRALPAWRAGLVPRTRALRAPGASVGGLVGE